MSNAWVAEQIREQPDCRGEFFVRPAADPEWVREQVRKLGLHGFKCYHTHADVTPTWEADIPAYLPEPIRWPMMRVWSSLCTWSRAGRRPILPTSTGSATTARPTRT